LSQAKDQSALRMRIREIAGALAIIIRKFCQHRPGQQQDASDGLKVA
jgi:hypothetical protein